MDLTKRKEIRQYFNSQSDTWRIEAVIHDGNWYDRNKWKRVAKVPNETLTEWIEKNKHKLIISDANSFRISYDDIVKWYDEQDLDLEESIVPNNFPPKLWGEITETDVFINAPRRRVGSVNFATENDELFSKVKAILKGVAKISPDDPGRHRAYGLSAAYMKALLSKGLTEREFESLDLKSRAILLQRELADLPEEWLEAALDFYANTFAPGILKSSMSTIEIYLPDRHDIHSQTVIWVINAIKKFDENASVPFSGYLSSVLRHWPYNLPDDKLGKVLAKFQRDKKRAIDNLREKHGEKFNNYENFYRDDIIEEMGISFEDYIQLNSQHENWLSEVNATTLTWADSANEKRGKLLGVSKSETVNVDKLNKMSVAVIEAALITENWDSAFNLIRQLDKGIIDENIREKLTPEFINNFAECLNIGIEI